MPDNDGYSDESESINRNKSNGNQKNGFSTTYDSTKEHNGNGLEMAKFDEPEPQKKSWSQTWAEYPKSVMFIFGNEFCERFSYYGMRAVLTLYLVNILNFSQGTATILFSVFAMLCYFSPILGSILADGYIGKFHTIMWVSLLYASGNVILAVAASIGPSVHPWLDFIGLIVIGLGTGGIKPCVQPFGADQFRKGQERELAQFFSIFYFLINAGSTISIIVTPMFRVIPCEGQTTCYPLSFGVPAALMVIAVIFFALGGFWYKKMPPKGNVFAKVAGVIIRAIKNKTTFEVKREHWLDHYMDSHNCSYDDDCRELGKCQKVTFVEDIKAFFRILVVFVPLPIFWALYDQQGSTWVIQATEMEYLEIAKDTYFLPDQMGVLNAILIMVLIPIFSLIIYPLANKCFKVTPLRKMCVGCFLAGVAYLVCMAIQINIRPTLPTLPDSGMTIVNVSNYVNCDKVQFLATDENGKLAINATLQGNETGMFQIGSRNLTWDVDNAYGATPCPWVANNKGKFAKQSMLLSPDTVGYTIFADDTTDLIFHKAVTLKSQSGEAVLTINVNYYADSIFGPAENVTVAFCKDGTTCNPKDEEVYVEFGITDRSSKYKDAKLYKWNIFLRFNDSTFIPTGQSFQRDKMGGIWTLTLLPDPQGSKNFTSQVVRQSPDNTYSIMWQVPQYFVISVAEVLFSITGYELAYSQAPHSMKAVVFAFYLITDAIGNVIILIITSVADFGADMTWAFLIYACLMFFITAVFILISIRYKYTLYVRDGDEEEKAKK